MFKDVSSTRWFSQVTFQFNMFLNTFQIASDPNIPLRLFSSRQPVILLLPNLIYNMQIQYIF